MNGPPLGSNGSFGSPRPPRKATTADHDARTHDGRAPNTTPRTWRKIETVGLGNTKGGRGAREETATDPTSPPSFREEKTPLSLPARVNGGLALVERLCSKCRLRLPLAEFAAHPKGRDGLQSWCRGCQREGTKRWRAKNREAINAARRVGPFPETCADCATSFEAAHPSQKRCPECQAAMMNARRR